MLKAKHGNCYITDTITAQKEYEGEELQLFGTIGVYFIDRNNCYIVTDSETELNTLTFKGKSYIKGVKNDFFGEVVC